MHSIFGTERPVPTGPAVREPGSFWEAIPSATLPLVQLAPDAIRVTSTLSQTQPSVRGPPLIHGVALSFHLPGDGGRAAKTYGRVFAEVLW